MDSERQAADFDRFEAALASIGSPFVVGPRTGVDPDEVRHVLASVGLAPPQGLIDWFGWRNGDGRNELAIQRTGNRIIGSMCAITAEDGARVYRDFRATLGDLDLFTFERGWFPIMVGLWTGTVCVDCGSQPGSIVFYDTTVMKPSTADERLFGSVAEMIEAFAQAVDDGWIDTDPDSPKHLLFRLDAVPEEHWGTLLDL